jgi:uncharacterized protein HemX
MTMPRKYPVLSVLAIACAVLLAASDASAGPIRNRKVNQQERIAQGVRSGELTAGETARLEGRERALNQEERDMRKLDGGRLTGQDRRTINQQQNQLSRHIYRQKHDGQTQ